MNVLKNLKLLSQQPLTVCSFYCYQPISEKKLPLLKNLLLKQGEKLSIRGLILLSSEGINATLVGSGTELKNYLQYIKTKTFPFQGKFQKARSWGFKKLRVKIKKEIVRSGIQDLKPPSEQTHLTPDQWENALKKKQSIVLDIRNHYEVQLGAFKKSKHLNLKKFQDFPASLKNWETPKDKEILICCTGGIRCEKALSEMNKQGFTHVKQLQGGILNYLSQFPKSHFEGDLFVFDHRVSLNQNLKPSEKYQLCPHCGQPGKKVISCCHCQKTCVVCVLCLDQNKQTCSKNCAYHHRMGHRFKNRAAEN